MDPAQRWTEFYTSQNAGFSWPSEQLVILLKSRAWPNPLPEDLRGLSALDVGFGSANNLALLHTLEMKLAGVEISQEICDAGNCRLESIAATADLRVGVNAEIPFDSGKFDLLVSWNAVHYEDTIDSFRAALSEFHRVLARGGVMVISTVAPKHMILRNHQPLALNRKQIVGDPIRDGVVFCCFDTIDALKSEVQECFSDVFSGELFFQLENYAHHAWLVIGKKE